MGNPAARKALIAYHRKKGKLARSRKHGLHSPVLEYKRQELMCGGGVRPGKWADWGHSTHKRNGVSMGTFFL